MALSNIIWSPGGRRRERPEIKWEKEVERVMKERSWRRGKSAAMATENQ